MTQIKSKFFQSLIKIFNLNSKVPINGTNKVKIFSVFNKIFNLKKSVILENPSHPRITEIFKIINLLSFVIFCKFCVIYESLEISEI